MNSRGQSPQPQYLMQLPVSAHLTGRPRGRPVVLAQKLVMKPYGQHTQDLDGVVGIKLMHRLSAHTPAGYQRRHGDKPWLEARAVSSQMITAASSWRVLAAVLVVGSPRRKTRRLSDLLSDALEERPEDRRLGQNAGAKVGANVHRHQATSGVFQPASSQVNAASGDAGRHQAAGWS